MKPKKMIMDTWNRMQKGFLYQYKQRRLTKRFQRSLWITQIQAAVTPFSYNQAISSWKLQKILLNRKMLASLAQTEIHVFHHLYQFIKKRHE